MSEKYEARELDAALAIVNMCTRGIEAIPEKFYSPVDEYLLKAYQELDEAYCALRNAVDEQLQLLDKGAG